MTTDLQPGALFEGRWRIERKLGEGGFAIVFAAVEERSGERVAVKVLKHDTPSGYRPATASRARRETAILAQLECEYTVRLVGHGNTADGLGYLVFEHIDGIELRALIDQRGRLETHEILHILEQVLVALDEAHRKNLLHRDLKPANILVHERAGDPLSIKVIDFGVARSTDPNSTSITQTGALVGTPRYMSPEQLLSKPLTPASDIYSLGLIALEMVSGRDALHGSSIHDQIDRMLSGHVLSIPELERGGHRLRDTITKMCAQKPHDRYPSARAVLAALRTTAPAAPFAQEPSPRSGTALGLAALGIAVVAALVFAVWEVDDEPPPRQLTPRRGPAIVAHDHASHGEPEPPPLDPAKLPVYWSPGCFEDQTAAPDNVWMPPDAAGEPVPLVVLFHDMGVNHLDFLNQSGFVETGREKNFAVMAVKARSVKRRPYYNPWTPPDELEGQGHERVVVDPAIADVLDVLKSHCIDMRRVYAVGHGSGGGAAQMVACGEPFAGVATVATFSKDVCDVTRRIPRLEFNPLDTSQNPLFKGLMCGESRRRPSRTLNEINDEMARVLGCSTSEPEFANNGQAQTRTWDCEEGAFEARVVPGGRPWPGVRYDPASDRHGCHGDPPTIDYAAEIWEFFDKHWAPKRGSAGCAKTNVKPGGPLLIGFRSLASYIPNSYSPNDPIPLVVFVHDDNREAEESLRQTGLVELAEREGFAVVAPRGRTKATWKFDDLATIETTVELFMNNACVDLDRVYAVGDGRGGVALDALGCQDWFVALANNSHVPRDDQDWVNGKLNLPFADTKACAKLKVRPTLLVRPEFTPECDNVSETVWRRTSPQDYADVLGCSHTTRPTELAGQTCETYEGCEAGFTLCLPPGTVWPRPGEPMCQPVTEFRTAEAMWEFFESVGERERATDEEQRDHE